MGFLLIIVSFASLLTFCQSLTVRDNEHIYEPELKRYIYPDSQITPDSLAQENGLQYYKANRRSGKIPTPTVQYIIPDEDAIPETEYNYPTQQPLEARNDDNIYPDYEQLTKRLGPTARKPPVEQYLKEVAPTTKTTYNRRAGNYLRSNGQATVKGNEQRTEESQRSVLKQSPFHQHVLQSEQQQKPQFQPMQYEVPVQQQTNYEQPIAASLSQYQNALLAHQKVLLEASSPAESKSSIYVNHAIPRKPARKLVKPKQSPVDEDLQYYQQLEQYQQQAQSTQPHVFEQQQPAQVMYQAKLQYSKEHANVDEATTYQQPFKQYQQQILQYQPSAHRQTKKASRRPVKYQQLYQQNEENSYPTVEYQPGPKPVEIVPETRSTHLRQGPKYLPEPKPVRYQSQPEEESDGKYQQMVLPISHQQPLISYEDAIAKLHSEQLRPRLPAVRQQTHRSQGQVQQGKYQLQYPVESRPVANQEDTEVEHVGPERTLRLRSNGRVPTYRQAFPSSSVRYYRNLARPVPYTNYE